MPSIQNFFSLFATLARRLIESTKIAVGKKLPAEKFQSEFILLYVS